MRMVEIFQCLALHFECLYEAHLTVVFSVTGGYGNFNLLDSNHLARGGIEGKIYATIRSFANEFTTNPFEYR